MQEKIENIVFLNDDAISEQIVTNCNVLGALEKCHEET